jgi:hypothetical protein
MGSHAGAIDNMYGLAVKPLLLNMQSSNPHYICGLKKFLK